MNSDKAYDTIVVLSDSVYLHLLCDCIPGDLGRPLAGFLFPHEILKYVALVVSDIKVKWEEEVGHPRWSIYLNSLYQKRANVVGLAG
jgi:hypothetical protein